MEYGSIAEKKPSSSSYSLIRLRDLLIDAANHSALAILITIDY